MQEHNRVLRAVPDAPAVDPGTHDLAGLLARVCQELAETVGFDRVAISRFDEEQRDDVPMAAFGDEDSTLEEIVGLPLRTGSRRLGCLEGWTREPRALEPAEDRLLRTFALVTATLLEQSLLADELRRLDELKSRFVSVASHELRTPVAVVYGVVETLHEHAAVLTPDQRFALVQAMVDSARRLRLLVEQLLDLSRVDEAEVDVAPQPVHVRASVEELLRQLAPGRADELRVRIRPDLRARLDPVAFERIVSNLITNALTYGRPPVIVSAGRRGRTFRLTVEDRGRGVEPAFVPTLFDRFTRSDASGSSRMSGAGLGLAIARSYAQAHGGDLAYEPAEPHGARFTLTVPQSA